MFQDSLYITIEIAFKFALVSFLYSLFALICILIFASFRMYEKEKKNKLEKEKASQNQKQTAELKKEPEKEEATTTETEQNETPSKRKELNTFIHDNYPLLATIGVFGALTALFVRLEGFEFIAFIPLMIFFVLMWELLSSSPKIYIPLKDVSRKLAVFNVLMMTLMLGVGLYILFEYVTVYYQIISLAIFLGIYVYGVLAIEDRLRLLERLEKKAKKGEFAFIQFVFLLIVVVTGFAFATYFAELINALLST